MPCWHFQVLNLSFNQLSYLPDGITGLIRLQELFLSSNCLGVAGGEGMHQLRRRVGCIRWRSHLARARQLCLGSAGAWRRLSGASWAGPGM